MYHVNYLLPEYIHYQNTDIICAVLLSGNEAKSLFTNLRNRYSRDKKKGTKANVSATGMESVSKVKEEQSDIFPYLKWLDTFYKPRKTVTNIIQSDSEESEEIDETTPEENKTDSTESTGDKPSSNNFGSKSLKSKIKRKSTKDIECEAAELAILKSRGSSLGQKQAPSPTVRDEDDLFAALIASQLGKIAPDRKVMVEMQILNIIYQEMLASITPASHAASNPAFIQQQSSLENNGRPARKSFHFPNMQEPLQENQYQPGQLFYRSQCSNNNSPIGFLEDLTAT